jgi:hypothetical protein
MERSPSGGKRRRNAWCPSCIKAELRHQMHEPVADVGAWLRKVVTGYYRHHAVPSNIDRLSVFRQRVRPLSVEGLGQNNPDRSEGPWGGVEPDSKAARREVLGPTQSGTTDSEYEMREGWMQTMFQRANAGSRLKPLTHREGPSDMPAFQPYWGRPAVRNDRAGRWKRRHHSKPATTCEFVRQAPIAD